MKNLRLVFTVIGVWAVVGSALALPRSIPNLLVNRNGICVVPSIAYSTIPGVAVTPSETVYKGTVGAPAGGANCVVYTGQVYIND